MIILKDITKTYGEGNSVVHALKGINLEINDGTLLAIVGKSGSGKTTLMNIIAGLDSPTSGEIFHDEMELSLLNEDDLAEFRNTKVGFIFQEFYLEPVFTVLENVCMPLTIAGVARIEREQKAKVILESLGLLDKITRKISDLSGGEKQRVCIARALISNPSVILADEPTGNLDSTNGEEVLKMLKEISQSGKTVILVTHNEVDSQKYANRIIRISDGCVVSDINNISE